MCDRRASERSRLVPLAASRSLLGDASKDTSSVISFVCIGMLLLLERWSPIPADQTGADIPRLLFQFLF